MNKTSAVLLACLALGASGCGDDGEVKITKTSDNTWTIEDPYNSPNLHVDETCQSEGKVVVQLQTPGEAYSYLNVVCADPKPAPTPVPTSDDYLP